MMRVMFFIMGVPMMILSFFEAVDVMPYVDYSSLIVDGVEIELSEEQQEQLNSQILQMFENAHTLPSFGVVFNDMYQEQIQQGKFVSLKFGEVLEVNGLPFDELVFEVVSESQGINLMRGMNGVFQGRCIYVDLLEKNMQQISEFVDNIVLNNEESVDESILDKEGAREDALEISEGKTALESLNQNENESKLTEKEDFN